MTSVFSKFRQRMFGISAAETSFARRGFHQAEDRVRARLERVGQAFVSGYNAALKHDRLHELTLELELTALEFRGFAFEGAAMALCLLDYFSLRGGKRFQAFLNGPGHSHTYMLHVGAGWMLARLPQNPENFLARLDPLLGWLAIDGFGFHEGYFHWQRSFKSLAVPKKISGYALQVFDQGLGRSLWFVECADLERIASTIARFPVSRRADLWSGIGLASAYAGGVDAAALGTLRQLAGQYYAHLAQGVAFAAKARQRAGNQAEHTKLAAEIICGMSADEAALITDLAAEEIKYFSQQPNYEAWRKIIQSQFVREGAIV
jgi:enediyne biosynthesis protein E3